MEPPLRPSLTIPAPVNSPPWENLPEPAWGQSLPEIAPIIRRPWSAPCAGPVGPGIFGADAAARHHFGIPAADLSRHQAAGLAAVLPAPLRRRPQSMGWYTNVIEQRMSRMGW